MLLLFFVIIIVIIIIIIIIIIALVRGELFSLSLGCRDTLNIFLGCFLSFLREHICGPLL